MGFMVGLIVDSKAQFFFILLRDVYDVFNNNAGFFCRSVKIFKLNRV